MTPALSQAIDGLYEAFGDVPKPVNIVGCSCCIEDKDIPTLLSKPLRELAPAELTHYAASAFLTVGEVADYLYFLPRIMEILATDFGWWPDPEVVARAINTAGFNSWSEVRRGALLLYFDAVVEESLTSADGGFDLDSWICALGRLHLDLTPYLTRIAKSGSRLIEFYESNSARLINGRLSNGFWDEAPEEEKQVVAWFQSPETQRLISAGYGMA